MRVISRKGVVDVADVPSIGESFGKLPRQPELFVQLAERQEPGVAGNLVRRGHYHNRFECEKIKRQLKSSLRNHCVPPCLRKGACFLTP